MNGVLVGMEYAKAINTTQIESTVGRTEYGIFYVFAVQSTVQLIEPGETDVLILRIYVDACDTVTGRYPDVSIFVLNNARSTPSRSKHTIFILILLFLLIRYINSFYHVITLTH